MTKPFQVTIVGGGIVGLATALALLHKFPGISLTLLEKEKTVAAHQTGHNSGVIHSGLYYRPGSFKAKLCVSGAREMVDFCRENGIAHEITGKVVVATEESELPRLEELYRRGTANGIPGIEKIGPERLKEIEPRAAGIAALWVPGTGIVDYKAVSEKMADIVRRAGGEILLNAPLSSAQRMDGRWYLHVADRVLETDFIINCGGLHSDRVAKSCGADPGVKIVPFRGEYYTLTSEAKFYVRGLIYPVPDPAFPFLGVHFTRMIGGGVEAGPNAVLAFRREGYRKTDFRFGDLWETMTYPGFWKLAAKYPNVGFGEFYRSLSKKVFVRSLQKLVPAVGEMDLEPGGSGVRAQALNPAGQLLDDFCFKEEPGALHVLNAPSPAATASLPIGRAIADKVVC